MRRILLRIFLISIVLFLIPSSGISQGGIKIKEKRLALVIGNGAYRSAPLRNPVNDARDMAVTLRNMGFNVIHLENTNQRKMEDAIRDFGKNLRNGGIGVFYYAGHGMQVQGRNYLIPIGADIYKEADIKYEAVDVGRLLDEMYDAGNGLNIVLLDACRDNPFARSFRSSSKGLARMDAPKGTFITYATAPGSVASDGTGRNGIYTKHLIRHMATPGLSVEKVLKRVRVDVVEETGGKQIPWESSSLMGDFSFMPAQAEGGGTVTASQPMTSGDKKANYEILFWESIKDSNDIQMHKEYLRKFPNGMFSGLAEIKIRNLSEGSSRAKIASVPKSQKNPSQKSLERPPAMEDRAGSKMTLAIFPWKPADEYWNWIVIDAIEKTIKETQLFNLAFSFYEVDRDFKVKKITQEDILSTSEVDSPDALWAGTGIFGPIEPRTDLVIKIANHLRVDAVLMCNVKIQDMDPPNADVFMYLINVRSGEKIRVHGYTSGFDENGFRMSRRLGKALFHKINPPR